MNGGFPCTQEGWDVFIIQTFLDRVAVAFMWIEGNRLGLCHVITRNMSNGSCRFWTHHVIRWGTSQLTDPCGPRVTKLQSHWAPSLDRALQDTKHVLKSSKRKEIFSWNCRHLPVQPRNSSLKDFKLLGIKKDNEKTCANGFPNILCQTTICIWVL